MITGAKRTRLRPLGRMALSQGLGSKKMPSQHLLGRYPFTGEDGSVTLPESYFAIMGVGPFFTDSGVPINVPQVLVEEWIETNGQPMHWWIYRHWLYVYDSLLITQLIANKCSKITKYNQMFSEFLTFGEENITFNGAPIEV